MFHTAVYVYVYIHMYVCTKELRLVRPIIIIMWYCRSACVCAASSVRVPLSHQQHYCYMYRVCGEGYLYYYYYHGVCVAVTTTKKKEPYIYLSEPNTLYTQTTTLSPLSCCLFLLECAVGVCGCVLRCFASCMRVCVCVRVGTPPFLLDARKNQPRNAIIRDTHTYAFPYDMTMMMMMR